MRARAGLLGAALALMTSPVLAQESDASTGRWELDARASWIVMGGGSTRATGGLMPTLAARRIWQIGEKTELSVGASLGVFGFGGDPHWIGVLGGPSAGVALRPVKALSVGLTLSADFGRVATFNAWGLGGRWIGFFPAASVVAGYDIAEHVALAASFQIHVVNTLAWSGASFEPTAGARFFW